VFDACGSRVTDKDEVSGFGVEDWGLEFGRFWVWDLEFGVWSL